jgi:3-hydroxyacyl-CoA dehydrogenase/enoyl-CoA hydratase/3-hydroxybutyryl-CoA epimerase
LVNEAVLCLGDGAIRSVRDGDVAAILGLGFPPFRGGPFRYVDALGAPAVEERLEVLTGRHGARFAPAPLLLEHAKDDRRFVSA